MIEVCLQCPNARERRRAAYVFRTMFSTLGLPWRLAERPRRGKAESEVTPTGLPALVVYYGDQLADELRDRLARGGEVHIVCTSGREKRALCLDGDQLDGVVVGETPLGYLAQIESDIISATLRCLSGIEGETGKLREKSRPGDIGDGKGGTDLAQMIGAPGSTHCIVPLQRAGEQIVGFVMTRPGKRRAARQGRLVEILFRLARLWVILKVGMLRRVPVYQTNSVRDPVFIRWVASLNPDLIVVFSCNQIIPEEIITLPHCGCINVHPSLLPKYRGAHPHFWVLVKGEAVTGATVHYIDVGVDSGDIVIQQAIPIRPRDTMFSLNERLNQLGARLLVKAVRVIQNGKSPRIPQDHAQASHFPPLGPKVGLIDWETPAPEIIRFIRILNPRAGQLRNPMHFLRHLRLKVRPYTYHGQTRLEIKQATELITDEKPGRPGQVLSVRPGKGIVVATGDGNAVLIIPSRPNRTHLEQLHLQVGDILGETTSGKEVRDGAGAETDA